MVEEKNVGISSKGVFKFQNGVTRDIDPGLFKLSAVINKMAEKDGEFELVVDSEVDVIEIELMNDFSSFLREKFMAKLQSEGAKKDYWFDFIPQNSAELQKLIDKKNKDLLIGGANVADIYDVPSFMSFCTYFLVKQSESMNLQQLREFLNEEDDFTDEQRKIISECEELKNL